MDKFIQNLIVEIGEEDMCSKTLMPGASVLGEYVEECGAMAWVQLGTVSFSAAFPAPVATPNNCAYGLAIPVTMGILRAAPQMKQRGRDIILPNNAEQTAAAHKQYDDIETLRRALMRSERQVEDFIAGSYTPMGPETGVVGGAWSFTFGID
jgi:hypothetical protein